jgi:hypothetical protein
MKSLFGVLLGCAIATASSAQSVHVSGVVKDKNNNPVAWAFVKEAGSNIATYSNANGQFNLNVNKPNSKLIVSAANLKAKSIDVNNGQDISVMMDSDAADPATSEIKVADDAAFNAGLNRGYTFATTTGGLNIRVVNFDNSTKGSPYLFSKWTPGYAITTTDSLIQNNILSFNYDKTTGDLLLTGNKKTVLAVDTKNVKEFVFFDESTGSNRVFEMVKAISPDRFEERLATGKNYTLYKRIATRFVKANFVTNGITSSGNNYDEYIDEPSYYIINNAGVMQKVDLKKKSLIKALITHEDKAKKFFSESDADIDENFVVDLVRYVNS